MARAAQTVAETEFQKVGLRESTTAEIETDLRAVQVELEDLRRKLTAAEDALARTRITAPEAGRVYGLRFHTHGGDRTRGVSGRRGSARVASGGRRNINKQT